VFSYTLIIE